MTAFAISLYTERTSWSDGR